MKKVLMCALLILTGLGIFSVRFVKNSVDAQVVSPVFTNVFTNSGFEESDASDPTTALGWTPFQGGFQRTSAVARTGASSIQVTNSDPSAFAGAAQRIDFNQTTMQPVFIGGFVKGENISAAPGTHFGASLYAEIHLQSGRVVFWNTVMSTGTFDWRWIGFNTGSVSLVNEPISYIFVIPVVGQSTGTAWFDDISVQEITPYQSAITLMFDDGSATDITVAKKVMDPYGFAGTSAIITSEIGNDGFMTTDQLQNLSQGGWEIASHTVTHRDLTLLSTSEISQELQNSKNVLTQQGFTVTSLALPFGAYNGEILDLAQKNYTSARAFEIGDNPQGLFPYDVKVRPIINTTTVAEVQGWIAEAQRENRWIVLSFHELSDTGDDAFHTSPQVFSQIIRAVSDSAMNIVTYNQGVAMFGVSH